MGIGDILKNLVSALPDENIRFWLDKDIRTVVVRRLLDRYLDEQGRPALLTDTSGRCTAPAGIDDIPGPTLVCIDLPYAGRSSAERIRPLLGGTLFGSVLLIGVAGTAKARARMEADLASAVGLPLRIWDQQHISELLGKYSDSVFDLVPRMAAHAVGKVISAKLRESWRRRQELRDERIDALSQAYARGRLSIFVGAGVSTDCGLPTWEELLTDLFLELVRSHSETRPNQVELAQIVKALRRQQKYSPLLEARYVRLGLGDLFVRQIIRFLYKDMPKAEVPEFPVLKGIAALSTGGGLRGIVTYNFDDLLEEQLRRDGVTCVPVYAEEAPDLDETALPVYHVHGFLPRDSSLYPARGESDIVFSEEEFQRLFLDPYCWSNLTQLQLLRESTCLFVGQSMTDPNLRRLLGIAARSAGHPRHYAILKREQLDLPGRVDGKEHDVRAVIVERVLQSHYGLQEASLAELGVSVIWIDDFSEIGETLKSVHSGSRGRPRRKPRPAPRRTDEGAATALRPPGTGTGPAR